MRKLEIQDAVVMQLAIREEINRSEEARYDHRLHGLLLVSSGRSCNEVGTLFGEAATTVQRWVRRFEESGFAGLREGERTGRPRSLDERSWRRIETDLRKSPEAFGLQANLWDGPVLSEHLQRNYGITLGVRQCQRMFRQMGFRLRKPRPQVAQSDPLAVSAAKKTAATGKARRR
ncbi:helix-turn-helix domain-containing protein [Roseateles sp.]|jgi:transposase|uniref:helix-turn-helix domain-containing protein n=1 Tax=Roseateles sp. TaxID=1971397 RepID=UPI003951E209